MTITPLPGEDWTNFLKAKLEDRNPKCGNCRYWEAKPDIHPTIGYCRIVGIYESERTPDLSLCSAWEKKE